LASRVHNKTTEKFARQLFYHRKSVNVRLKIILSSYCEISHNREKYFQTATISHVILNPMCSLTSLCAYTSARVFHLTMFSIQMPRKSHFSDSPEKRWKRSLTSRLKNWKGKQHCQFAKIVISTLYIPRMPMKLVAMPFLQYHK